ncbi:MAG TPA: hypothetical protein VF331_22570 [Polyangiales bacterium]
MTGTRPQQPRTDGEEPVVAWLFLIVGLLPVATALVRGGVWGAEPSLGLLMMALGGVQLAACHRAHDNAPR